MYQTKQNILFAKNAIALPTPVARPAKIVNPKANSTELDIIYSSLNNKNEIVWEPYFNHWVTHITIKNHSHSTKTKH
jgi:hypothetical protein